MRTLRALLTISAVGAVLAIYSAWTAGRDVRLATGPQSEAQERWLVSAASRPDLATFFKRLTRDQKLAMAQAVGRYDDAPLAKIAGTCIETFDPQTRDAFAAALIRVAKAHPKEVVDQMVGGGGIKQRAIANALHPLGAVVLPMVAEKLTVGDARTNAVSFLADSGLDAVPYVAPKLADKDKDVRLAAADCLGKLRATSATDALTKLAQSAAMEERPRYWAAIASIGNPSSEPFLTSLISDVELDGSQRAQAALGLGRVATESALRTVARFLTTDEAPLSRACIDALRSAGDRGLAVAPNEEARVAVAAGVLSPAADAVLRAALERPATAATASALCADRPQLHPELIAAARRFASDGEVADAVVHALDQTSSGRKRLQSLRNDPDLGGFVRRVLR